MKRLAYLLLSCAALATSCSKDNDAMPSGPKEYQVEYKVTSNAPVSDYLSYTNESGGNTTLNNTPLPATYRFKRTMKQDDNLDLVRAAAVRVRVLFLGFGCR